MSTPRLTNDQQEAVAEYEQVKRALVTFWVGLILSGGLTILLVVPAVLELALMVAYVLVNYPEELPLVLEPVVRAAIGAALIVAAVTGFAYLLGDCYLDRARLERRHPILLEQAGYRS